MKSLGNAVVLGLSVFAATLAVDSAAFSGETIIFAEDFESYAAGSDLDGQGGWTRTLGSSEYPVDIGPLGSKSARGPLVVNSNEQNFVEHSISWNGTGRITFSFDAYMSSPPLVSHNSGVVLEGLVTGPAIGWYTNLNAPNGWLFRASPNDEFVGNRGLDEPVSLEVVIDAEVQEVFGRADFGSGGLYETMHYSLVGSDLAEINVVSIQQDFRGRQGGDFDNIVVTFVSPVVDIDIDVKPGSDPNCLNTNGHGVVPVAVLGREEFDVTEIDTEFLLFDGLQVRVRGNRGPLCAFEFSNDDDFLDLVCHFEDDPTMWVGGDSEGTVTGVLFDGTQIEGTDSICVVP